MDYFAWAQRARSFLRSLTRLPQPLSVHCSIEAPCDGDRREEWLESAKCSLPPELKRFLSAASAWCSFHYCWEMTDKAVSQLQDVAVPARVIHGGASFCEGNRYSNYDNREFFEQLLPEVEGIAQSMMDTHMPDELREAMKQREGLGVPSLHEIIGQSMGSAFRDEHRAHGRIPLLELTADANERKCVERSLDPPSFAEPQLWICLETEATEGARRVVRVDAGSQAVTVVSDSFDDFLLAWEQACYLTPTAEVLELWSDSDGKLAPGADQSRLLRDILTSFDEGVGR